MKKGKYFIIQFTNTSFLVLNIFLTWYCAFLISDFISLGIEKIHELGGKVNLAYGGQYQQERRYGISAENGGGGRNIAEDKVSADQLARWSTCRLRFFC